MSYTWGLCSTESHKADMVALGLPPPCRCSELLYLYPTILVFLVLTTQIWPKSTCKMSSLARAATVDQDPDPDRGPALRAFLIFMTVMVVIAVSLRFWSRALGMPLRHQPRFMWDDWTALASAVCPAPTHFVATRLHTRSVMWPSHFPGNVLNFEYS